MSLSIPYIKRLFTYNPDTGLLYWNKRPLTDFVSAHAMDTWNTRYSNNEAGGTSKGYRRVRIDGNDYAGHRLIWAYTSGIWPNKQIDHINGKRSDNRLINLRLVTFAENRRNQRIHTRNTSGHTGVSLNKRTGKYVAYICKDSHLQHIGSFSSISEAVTARKSAEKYHGFHKNHGRKE